MSDSGLTPDTQPDFASIRAKKMQLIAGPAHQRPKSPKIPPPDNSAPSRFVQIERARRAENMNTTLYFCDIIDDRCRSTYNLFKSQNLFQIGTLAHPKTLIMVGLR
jgi:hypothetical protein